jgi:hypothetical protein
VIAGNLNLIRVTTGPHKADPKPVIDPDRVLPGSVALQRLEMVAGRAFQVLEVVCGVQLFQLALCGTDRVRQESPFQDPGPQRLPLHACL